MKESEERRSTDEKSHGAAGTASVIKKEFILVMKEKSDSLRHPSTRNTRV